VAARDLPKGHQLAAADFAYKKPGTGIPAARRDELVGRTLRQSITADTHLREDDFE
jgi:N-acetylneuraminate synthase